jgi:hypothetical protein
LYEHEDDDEDDLSNRDDDPLPDFFSGILSQGRVA